jgi:hypothetical protein
MPMLNHQRQSSAPCFAIGARKRARVEEETTRTNDKQTEYRGLFHQLRSVPRLTASARWNETNLDVTLA